MREFEVSHRIIGTVASSILIVSRQSKSRPEREEHNNRNESQGKFHLRHRPIETTEILEWNHAEKKVYLAAIWRPSNLKARRELPLFISKECTAAD